MARGATEVLRGTPALVLLERLLAPHRVGPHLTPRGHQVQAAVLRGVLHPRARKSARNRNHQPAVPRHARPEG
eukprot:10132518-Alexandrium_andersonii.AAC.1